MIRRPYPTEKGNPGCKGRLSEGMQSGTGENGGSVCKHTARDKGHGYGRG